MVFNFILIMACCTNRCSHVQTLDCSRLVHSLKYVCIANIIIIIVQGENKDRLMIYYSVEVVNYTLADCLQIRSNQCLKKNFLHVRFIHCRYSFRLHCKQQLDKGIALYLMEKTFSQLVIKLPKVIKKEINKDGWRGK